MAKSHPVLTPRQKSFCKFFVRHGCATQAAREAGSKSAFASRIGHAMTKKPAVAAEIARLTAIRDFGLMADAKTVVQTLTAIAFHDATKISQVRRTACQACWSVQGDQKRLSSGKSPSNANKRASELTHKSSEIDPECHQCHGDGITSVHFADTRDLPLMERIAYEGASLSKEGLKVKVSDRVKALDILARYLGLYKESSSDTNGPQIIIHANGVKLPPPKKDTK